MRILLVTILCCLGFGLPAQLLEMQNLGTNPGKLKCFYFNPNPADTTPKPLVVVLHGCTQSAEVIANASGWNDLARYYNFNVLYPQQKIVNNVSLCFNWFNSDDVSRTLGEVASVNQMVESFGLTFKTDTTKVFVYGVSSGAALAVAYAANFPDKINACAALAGGAYGTASGAIDGMQMMQNPLYFTSQQLATFVQSINPNYLGNYPRMLVLHGLQDNTVDPRNSDLIVKQFTTLHQVDSLPSLTQEPFANNPNVKLQTYNNDQGNWVVKHYTMRNIGHALPIDPGPAPKQGGLAGIFAKDLDFYSTYFIALDFGLAKY